MKRNTEEHQEYFFIKTDIAGNLPPRQFSDESHSKGDEMNIEI